MSTAQFNPTSQTLSIPKLSDDGSNWVDYKTKARTAMGSKGLIRHIDGTSRKPTPFAELNNILMFDATTPATGLSHTPHVHLPSPLRIGQAPSDLRSHVERHQD